VRIRGKDGLRINLSEKPFAMKDNKWTFKKDVRVFVDARRIGTRVYTEGES